MTIHDRWLAQQKQFHDDLDAAHAAELANLRQQKADVEAALTAASADLDAALEEIDLLEARIADLEADQGPWELIYETGFAGNDGWLLKNERQRNDASRNLPRNAVFAADGLHILGKRENYGTPGTDAFREFTTADILGRHIEVSNYFRAEVTASSPHARGLWPCPLWFRPLNHSDGEIDLMENFGGQPRAKATLHSEYSNRKMIGAVLPWPKAPDAPYTYVIEKTPGRIHITIDGHTLMDAGPGRPHTSSAFPWERIFETPERTWYPRITLQIGCGEDNPTCETGFPSADFRQTEMHVTSLRIWNLR